MSKTAEKNLWQWLKRGAISYKHALHIMRVENGTGNGTPDVEGCKVGGRQFWCELKVAEGAKKLKIKWQPGQLPWLRRRRSVGGRAYALIQVGQGVHARRYLLDTFPGELERSITEEELAQRSLNRYAQWTAIEIIELMTNVTGR